MKKIFNITKKKFIFLLIFSFCTININTCNSFADTQAEIDKDNKDLSSSKNTKNKIQQEKKKVQNTLNNLKNVKNDTEKYINILDTTLEALTNEMTIVESYIDMANATIANIEKELSVAVEKQNKQFEDMKHRIKYIYELGDLSFLKVIMGSTDISDFLNRVEYVSGITQYDRDKLYQLKVARYDVEYKKAQIKLQQEALVLLKEEQEAKKESIQSLLNAKNSEIVTLENELKLTEAELKKLNDEEKKQDSIIKSIEEKIKKRNSTRVLKGGFIWPCPSSHTITSAFGKRSSPTKGASTYHKGIDIGAKAGSNVLAAASGEVVISTYSYSAGNYIMIDHGSGMFTIYMHLSSKKVKEGDEVKQGQVIGLVGSTGISTGPHLHFGVRKNGEYVNPSNYV